MNLVEKAEDLSLRIFNVTDISNTFGNSQLEGGVGILP